MTNDEKAEIRQKLAIDRHVQMGQAALPQLQVASESLHGQPGVALLQVLLFFDESASSVHVLCTNTRSALEFTNRMADKSKSSSAANMFRVIEVLLKTRQGRELLAGPLHDMVLSRASEWDFHV